MQSAKNTVAAAKETASNVAATAKSGLDKTKATVQEKAEKLTAHHPAEKEMAEERKQEKIQEAEIRKQEAKQQNAAAREQTRSGYSTGPVGVDVTTAAVPGLSAAGGHVTTGLAEAHQIGMEAGTARPAAAHNPLSGSTNPAVRGMGDGFN